MSEQSIFLKACRREKTPQTPIWLMRQAGRYMKEYRDIRAKHSFLEVCRNKGLVTEITVHAQEKIKADAAIIFADILLVLDALGLGLSFLKNEGPSLKKPIHTVGQVGALPELAPEESLSYVFDAIRQTRKALKPEIPLIGFAGAPFTLCSYVIEQGPSKNFKKTKALLHADPKFWETLMEKITKVTIQYLKAQIRAGVQAVQIFDSWVGALTSQEYRKFVLPYSRRVIEGLGSEVPVIHFGTGTGPFLEDFGEAGGDVIGVDHQVPLDEAWTRIGTDKAIQGNLDPKILLGSVSEMKKEVEKILKQVDGRPGHIFNLGHGVLPQTPVENVIALVEMVHEMSLVQNEG